jgi:DNA-directed RNA polymerase
MTGDHAWQVRAACAEIARAAAYPEGPEAYPSSLPCHQDGSCNGLQHYAALARDVDGGSAVNLLPSERPADVYSTVLSRVLEKIEADAKSGHATAIFLLKHRAKTMVRDSVKRTVMTRVYGTSRLNPLAFHSCRLTSAED